MKKAINCFIPYDNEPSVQRTITSLQQSERVARIYLLATNSGKEEIAGCPVIQINTPASGDSAIIFIPGQFAISSLETVV